MTFARGHRWIAILAWGMLCFTALSYVGFWTRMVFFAFSNLLLLYGAVQSRRKAPEEEAAEAALRAAEKRFRSIIENGTDAITLVDENFVPLYRSPASERIFGWTLEERKKGKGGLMLTSHPDDMDHMVSVMKEVLRSPGKAIRSTGRTLRSDGQYIWIEASFLNLLDDESTKAIVINFRDVTEQKMAGDLLQQTMDDLRQLASHLQDVREAERTSMAREIHDELGQQLTGLKMDVSWLNRRADLNDEASRQKIRGILTLLDGTVGTVRRLAAELRPSILDDLGLPEALEWHSRQFAERTGTRVTFCYAGDPMEVEKGIATGMFRIYQESLTNIARHAEATQVHATLERHEDQLVLTVMDDGKGFDVDGIARKKTLGILGMKERTFMMGGRYEFKSEPGSGTCIRVSVPLAGITSEA